MNNLIWRIVINGGMFGPYQNEPDAREAIDRLTTYGDSLGIIWKRKELKLVKSRQWENNRGMITYEDIK